MTDSMPEKEIKEIKEVTRLTGFIARHLGELKEPDGPDTYYEYEDGRVRLRAMMEMGTPVEADIVREGKNAPVLRNTLYGLHPRQGLTRYNPGAWTGHLRSLEAPAEAAREQEEQEKRDRENENRLERFRPVDDSDIFPEQGTEQRTRPERK